MDRILASIVDPGPATRIIVSPEATRTAVQYDPIGDLMRYAERLRNRRPAPEIAVGDPEVAQTAFERAGILRLMPGLPTPDHLFGIPIRVDPNMPPDMMRVGDQYFILPVTSPRD